jgi:hypothetical protein
MGEGWGEGAFGFHPEFLAEDDANEKEKTADGHVLYCLPYRLPGIPLCSV